MKLKIESLSPEGIVNLRKLILDGGEVDDLFLCYLLKGFEEEIWLPLCKKIEERIDVFGFFPLKNPNEILETIVELLTSPAYIREWRVASNIRRSILSSEKTLTLDGFLDVLAHYVLEELKFQGEFEYLEEFKGRVELLRED